jgi:hypothetical protein
VVALPRVARGIRRWQLYPSGTRPPTAAARPIAEAEALSCHRSPPARATSTAACACLESSSATSAGGEG